MENGEGKSFECSLATCSVYRTVLRVRTSRVDDAQVPSFAFDRCQCVKECYLCDYGNPLGVPSKPIVVIEDKLLRLRCGASGQPKPHVEWHRLDGRPITDGAWQGEVYASEPPADLRGSRAAAALHRTFQIFMMPIFRIFIKYSIVNIGTLDKHNSCESGAYGRLSVCSR